MPRPSRSTLPPLPAELRSQGRGRTDPDLRPRLLELLRWTGPARARLSFAQIAEELGVSRQRVQRLARELGFRGRTKGRDGKGRLRGPRRERRDSEPRPEPRPELESQPEPPSAPAPAPAHLTCSMIQLTTPPRKEKRKK